MQTFTFSVGKQTVAEFVETTVGAIVAERKQYWEQEIYIVEASTDAEATELEVALKDAFSAAPLKDCVVEARRNDGGPAAFCQFFIAPILARRLIASQKEGSSCQVMSMSRQA